MPKILDKSFDELLEDKRRLATMYTPEWQPQAGDPGLALMSIFTHMHEEIINRLNKVPDKGFGAFLEMLGFGLRPAQPSKVPVTFHPAEGLSQGIFLPARTQVACEETEDHGPLTFETLKNLYVSNASLEHIFSVHPQKDAIYSHIDGKEFQPFTGTNLQKHKLYLGHKMLFGIKAGSSIKLRIDGVSSTELKHWSWKFWTGESWNEFGTVSPSPEEHAISLSPGNNSELKECAINGISSIWIEAQRSTAEDCPIIQDIKIKNITSEGTKPDMAFHNFNPLDLSKIFYPLGAEPRTFDSFYLACREAFSKKGANVIVWLRRTKDNNSSLPDPPKPNKVVLSLEYWNGTLWHVVDEWIDELYNLELNQDGIGEARFTVPKDIEEVNVGGSKNYWIRIRLAQGDYGKEYVDTTKYELVSDFKPPWADKIGIHYSFPSGGQDLEHCLTYNNLDYREIKIEKINKGFRPFLTLPDINSTLYLGFNRPLQGGNLSLFFHIIPLDYPGARIRWYFWSAAPNLAQDMMKADVLQLVSTEGLSVGTELLLYEELAEGRISERSVIKSLEGGVSLDRKLERLFTRKARVLKMVALEANDNTRYMTQSDTLEFLAPRSHESATFLAKSCYWLMGRLDSTISQAPTIRGIYPNTTWAEQRETVKDEYLGSSQGENASKYTILNKPATMPEIWVREGIIFSADEVEDLESQGIFIQEVKDDTEKVVDTWVKWIQVEDFFASGPKSRHFLFEGAVGEVYFGDGINGMIPPIGTDNIKASYRYGGGTAGNLASGEITSLKTLIGGIDRVVNPVAAEGGSDTESLMELMERGPHLIKSLGRAVTLEDFERLAKASSISIARTKCITTDGRVKIIVIPKGSEDQPKPSPGLLRLVRSYLEEQSLNTLTSGDLELMGPIYREIRISADVIPTVPDQAVYLEREIIKALKSYLHPLTGGPEGQGWDFGRDVHISDIYALLESIEGVDHTRKVLINDDPKDLRIDDLEMICSGEHKLTMVMGGSS